MVTACELNVNSSLCAISSPYLYEIHDDLFSFLFCVLQAMVQERTQQFLAIQEVSDLRQKTTSELVQTLVEKIADISEVFGNEEASKLPDVSGTNCVKISV